MATKLCDRLDIPCKTVTTSPIELKKDNRIQTGHMLCLVEIEDPKYNLNGVIYSDPTMGCPKNEELRRAFGGSTIPFSDGEEIYRNNNQQIDREQQSLSGLLLESGKISSKEGKIVCNSQEDAQNRKKQEEFIKVFREYCNDYHLSNCLFLELLKIEDATNRGFDLNATNNSKPEKKMDNFTKELLKSLQYDFWREGLLYERNENTAYLDLMAGLGDEARKLLKNKNVNPYQIHKEIMKKIDGLSHLSDDEVCKYIFGKSYIKAGENERKKVKRANEKYNNLALGVELQQTEKNELLSNVLKQVGLAMGKTEEEAVAYSCARRKYWTPEQEKEYAHSLQEGKSEEELKEIEENFNNDVARAIEESKKAKDNQANVESIQDSNQKDASFDIMDEINSIFGVETQKEPTFEELVGMQPDQEEKSFEELVGMQPDQEEKSFEELLNEYEQKNKDDEDDLMM